MDIMKTAIVTGASGSIGSAAVRALALDGFNVAINYNSNEKKAQQLVQELLCLGCDALAVRADVSDSAQVGAMVQTVTEHFGAVDVLVNNAGIAQQKLFTDLTDVDIDAMLNVNVRGAFNCCRAVLPYMINRKSGKIINISSVWGVVGASCEVHYSASKAAVVGLTRALAKEVGPSGICVNCIAPGVINTPMNDCFDDETMKQLAQSTPLCRIGSPRDVANAISFFASPASDFITGQTLCVDGGFAL